MFKTDLYYIESVQKKERRTIQQKPNCIYSLAAYLFLRNLQQQQSRRGGGVRLTTVSVEVSSVAG